MVQCGEDIDEVFRHVLRGLGAQGVEVGVGSEDLTLDVFHHEEWSSKDVRVGTSGHNVGNRHGGRGEGRHHPRLPSHVVCPVKHMP
nr:hypothetical protein GCM10017611_80350 [Rhodococcus wratislaviensis]